MRQYRQYTGSVRRGLLAIGLVWVCQGSSLCSEPGESDLAELEGKWIIALVDLPASTTGLDINVGRQSPVDFRELGKRIKNFGVAIRAGSRAMVTRVKVKGKNIEFQLGGGGFDWRFVGISGTAESKQLERQRAQTSAVSAGSRINVRLGEGESPQAMTISRLQQLLSPAITFVDNLSNARSQTLPGNSSNRALPLFGLRKGLAKRDVIATLGEPSETLVRPGPDVEVVVLRYSLTDCHIEVEIVAELVVGFVIRSE